MPRGQLWTDAEHSALLELVRVHGHNWQRVLMAWQGRPATQNSLRLEHRKLSKQAERPISTASESDLSSEAAHAQLQCTHGKAPSSKVMQVSTLIQAMEARAWPVRKTTSQNCPSIPGVQIRALPWVDATSSIRQLWCGRGWARAVYTLLRREEQAGRPLLGRDLLPSHDWLVHALQLDSATTQAKLLYCDLVRARRAWSSHLKRLRPTATRPERLEMMQSAPIDLELRDRLGIVQYPQVMKDGRPAALPTLLACGHKRVVIGGSDSRGVFYVGTELAMLWMGLAADTGRGTSTVARAQAAVRPQPLMRAIGNAIALPMAIAAVVGAFSAARWAPTGRIRYASLYSGAFDTFLLALRWLQAHRWPEALVVPMFAAEKSKACRRLLWATEAYPLVFSKAEQAAKAVAQPVDLLTSSPECQRFSTGTQLGQANVRLRKARAKREGRKTVTVLINSIKKTTPRVVLMEQVAGVAWLHATVLKAQLKALRKRCPEYVWYGRLADAADLRTPHHRTRLIVAGARPSETAPGDTTAATDPA
jgi:hypothetical protein